MAREAHRQLKAEQTAPRTRARSAVGVAVHTQASRGTSMASETRAGDACKARQGALGRADPHLAAFHQPLLEQQVTLCRLAAGAARHSAAAACIEWCLRTTRPAAPEGRGSSSTGRMPKERPPDRPTGRRQAARLCLGVAGRAHSRKEIGCTRLAARRAKVDGQTVQAALADPHGSVRVRRCRPRHSLRPCRPAH